MIGRVFDAFLAGSPVSVMFRATLERVLSADRMDVIFAEAATRQKVGELLFSTCVDLMALVVARVRKSVHAAYRAQADRVGVSVQSVYNKLAGIEPRVSEQMTTTTAADLTEAMRRMRVRPQTPLPGYDVRILDGNYLSGTEHRLEELRTLGAAALPGMTLCLFDPQWQLVRDVVACEDGHANERGLVDRVLPKAEAGQCWVADRNFCIHAVLFGLARRQAFLVIRHHPQVVGELLGRRRKAGRAADGTLYEQPLRVTGDDGQILVLRRVTVVLDRPTRFGETEVHLLANLPQRVSAVRIAATYRNRWSIETAFMHLATVLRSEVNTLGYPDAALFGFCIGLLLYNVLAFLESALRTAHPRRTGAQALSMYYLADEISGVYRGMMIAVPAAHWRKAFAELTPQEFADSLLMIAKRVDLAQFRANPPPRKKPPPKRQSGHRGNHVSTYKILQKRTSNC
jgi:IS4 transposase